MTKELVMTFFIAGDPAQALVPGGAILWGPGYPTADAASAPMQHLAATQSVPLILVEAVDFASAVRQLRDWPWAPPG
jgi:hypothetical protein